MTWTINSSWPETARGKELPHHFSHRGVTATKFCVMGAGVAQSGRNEWNNSCRVNIGDLWCIGPGTCTWNLPGEPAKLPQVWLRRTRWRGGEMRSWGGTSQFALWTFAMWSPGMEHLVLSSKSLHRNPCSSASILASHCWKWGGGKYDPRTT